MQMHAPEYQGCWWKSRLMMILFVLSVHQKYLKQVTFHNELTLAFLSVMGHKQRMMTDHHAAVVALTHEHCEQLWVS